MPKWEYCTVAIDKSEASYWATYLQSQRPHLEKEVKIESEDGDTDLFELDRPPRSGGMGNGRCGDGRAWVDGRRWYPRGDHRQHLKQELLLV